MDAVPYHDLLLKDHDLVKTLGRLRDASSDTLTPFDFLQIVQETLGISFIETRTVFEYFDEHMQPTVDLDTINERWGAILRRHQLCDD